MVVVGYSVCDQENVKHEYRIKKEFLKRIIFIYLLRMFILWWCVCFDVHETEGGSGSCSAVWSVAPSCMHIDVSVYCDQY